MLSQTAVFTRLVRHHMGPPPATVRDTATCGQTVALLRDAGVSSAVVTDATDQPIGIITEQDIVRRVAFRIDSKTPVGELMTSPVETIHENDYLYHGIARMQRMKLRHMPVMDSSGRVVGILNQHEALISASGAMMRQIERLTHSDTLEGMKTTKVAQVAVAEELFADTVPAPEIQAFLTRINNDLYRRIVVLCLKEMKIDDWGDPPVPFETIVMGSGGRGESFLGPDQDNGFILSDYPDAEHSRVDAWFIELAGRMTKALDEVGFDLCPGHVMATNPLWRKTLTQWKTQIDSWVGKGAGTVVRLCDIFFDFISVYGNGRMADELREHVTHVARRRFFLREMYRVDEEHGVALGFFGRLQIDRKSGPNRGNINLKLTGTLPLVGAVRLLALRDGIADTSTLGRARALRANGVLTDDEYDYLKGAFDHTTNLLLRQQLNDFRAGRPIGKHVVPSSLTKRETDMLVDGFRAIRAFRRRVRAELTAEVF